MNYNKKQNPSGFTLIELSIVLVIISLIVGGIVGGKALIKSAEIQHTVQKIKSAKTAMNNFTLQYDALPGDMRNATDYWPGITANGDGNTLYSTEDEVMDEEGGYLWHHLGLAEVYGPFSRPNSGNFSYEYGITVPEIFPDTAAVGQNRTGHGAIRYNIQDNFMQIGKWRTPGSDDGVNCAATDTASILAIDKKMDDGIASSGIIFAYVQSGSCGTGNNCTDYAGAGYDYQQPYGSVNYDKGNPDGVCRVGVIIP